MGFLRVNMQPLDIASAPPIPPALALHDSPESVPSSLSRFSHETGPVVIMVHGYKFAPGDQAHCPHEHILSPDPKHTCRKAKSWPRTLGADGQTPDLLGIAFGWQARGTIWQAYDQAAQAGRALAKLVQMIRHTMPHRPVHAIAHSLGARVILSALPHLRAGSINRALLLAGAEYHAQASSALESPAGRCVEIFSITSRENTLYDHLFETLIPSQTSNDKIIGRMPPVAQNWMTVPIDDAETLIALNTYGYRVAPRRTRVCHWSSYTRPGVFDLYQALLCKERPLALNTLRAMLPTPHRSKPQWHRLSRHWRGMRNVQNTLTLPKIFSG